MIKRNTSRIIAIATPSIMSLLMSIINSMIYQGVSWENIVVVVVRKWPLMLVFALVISQVLVIPIVTKITRCIGNKENIFLRSLLVVLGMSSSMTLVKLLINGVQFHQLIFEWMDKWPYNFCIALAVQMLFVGPLIRKIVLSTSEKF